MSHKQSWNASTVYQVSSVRLFRYCKKRGSNNQKDECVASATACNVTAATSTRSRLRHATRLRLRHATCSPPRLATGDAHSTTSDAKFTWTPAIRLHARALLGECAAAAQPCAFTGYCCHTGNTEGVSVRALVVNRSCVGDGRAVNMLTREVRTEFSAQRLAVHAFPEICCWIVHWPRMRARVRAVDEPFELFVARCCALGRVKQNCM